MSEINSLSQRERSDEDLAVRRSEIAKPEHPYHHFYRMTLRHMGEMMRAINRRAAHFVKLEDQLCNETAKVADLEQELAEARRLLADVWERRASVSENGRLEVVLTDDLCKRFQIILRAAEEGR